MVILKKITINPLWDYPKFEYCDCPQANNAFNPTSEHARFLEFIQTLYNARSWLPNWLAGGLTLALAEQKIIQRAKLNIKDTIKFLKDNVGMLFAIHYSCQNLSDNNESYSPRITSIAVLHIGSDVMHSFSLHLVAEIMGISRDQIHEHYDEIEKRMLKDFFEFVSAHDNYYWLHWNMSNTNYGFEALVHRYRVLSQEIPSRIEDSRKFNLSSLILRRYGNDCVDHPRLTKLMEVNGGIHREIISGEDEVAAFEAKEYLKLHKSTMAKVYWFQKMFFKLKNNKVKTQRSNISHKVNVFVEKPFVKLLGFIAVVYTIMQLATTTYNTYKNETLSADKKENPVVLEKKQ